MIITLWFFSIGLTGVYFGVAGLVYYYAASFIAYSWVQYLNDNAHPR